jgi:hypothetical protein
LRRVISIVVCGESLIADSDAYHHRFRLAEPSTSVVFTSIMEVNTLELSKLPGAADGTALWNWMSFMNADTEEDLAKVAQLDPAIGRAARGGVLHCAPSL